MTDNELMAKLGQKLQKVMAEVPNIPKGGWNDHYKYAFVTEPDVLDAVRTQCVLQGILLLPSILQVTREGQKTTITCQMDIVDTETGFVKSCTFAGEANDTQDKGLAKALVSGLKYWLLKAFMIPSGGDTDSEGAPKAQKATPAPKAAPVVTVDAKNECLELLRAKGIDELTALEWLSAGTKPPKMYDTFDDVPLGWYALKLASLSSWAKGEKKIEALDKYLEGK